MNKRMKNNISKTETIIGPKKNTITILFSGTPTIASYEFLRDYIDLRLALLKKKEMKAEEALDEEDKKL